MIYFKLIEIIGEIIKAFYLDNINLKTLIKKKNENLIIIFINHFSKIEAF